MPALRSQLYLWPGMLLMVATRLANQPHRHLASSLLLGLEGDFRLGVEGDTLSCRAALVAPNALQWLDSGGAPVAVVHLDPDLAAYRRIAGRLGGAACHRLPDTALAGARPELAGALAEPPDCAAARALLDRLLDSLAAASTPLPPLDARIARIAAQLRAAPPERLDPAALAKQAGLSESRLMHLFRDELGVPLRRFILNLRLQRAMLAYRPGMTLTDVAVEAGFYDQPHMVRTAREMLDFLPSLFADPETLQVRNCGA